MVKSLFEVLSLNENTITPYQNVTLILVSTSSLEFLPGAERIVSYGHQQTELATFLCSGYFIRLASGRVRIKLDLTVRLFYPPIHRPLVSSNSGTPRPYLRDMHNTLRNLPTGKGPGDSVNETLDDPRSTITAADSVLKSTVLKPTISDSETLSESLESLKEPCKPYPIPVGCEEDPPHLPFRLLFFAHFG